MHATRLGHAHAVDIRSIRSLRSTGCRILLAGCASAAWLIGPASSLHALEFTDPGGLCVSIPDGWLSYPQHHSLNASESILKTQTQDGSVRMLVTKVSEQNTPREIDQRFVEQLVKGAGGSLASYAERFVAVGHRTDFTFLTAASSQPAMGSVLWNGRVVYVAVGLCSPKGDLGVIAPVIASAHLTLASESGARDFGDTITGFRSVMTAISIFALIIVVLVIRKGMKRDARPRIHRITAPPQKPRSPPPAGRFVVPDQHAEGAKTGPSEP